MNIIAPQSITDNNIYSFSEIVYLSGYLKSKGISTRVFLLGLAEYERLNKEWVEEDTIFVVQFLNKDVLIWLEQYSHIFTGRRILYGLSAQTYKEDLAKTFTFDYIIPTNSFEAIVRYLAQNDVSELPHTLQEIQQPDYDIQEVLELPYIPIISSRGCKQNCSFCAISCSNKFTREYIFRDANDVFSELMTYYTRFNKTRFYFVDSCFVTNEAASQERATQLAQLLLENNIKIKFAIETRADCVNVNVFSKLKKAGLSRVLIGAENLNSNVLQRYNKQITLKQILDAVNILRELCIRIDLTMILFDPFTSRTEILDNLQGVLDYELYRHVEIHTVFRKLILIPGNRLKNIKQIKYTSSNYDSFQWYNDTVNYQINDGVIHCLSEALEKFHIKWKMDVDKHISKIMDIRRANEMRIRRKKTFFQSVKNILERADIPNDSGELAHELFSMERQLANIERI